MRKFKITIVINDDVYKKLKYIGKEIDRSLSGTVRFLVKEYYKKLKEEEKKNG